MWCLLWVLGCASTSPADRAEAPTGAPGPTDSAAPPGPTTPGDTSVPLDTATGDTAVAPVDEGLYPDVLYDCTQGVPPGPFVPVAIPGVVTSEAFVFDTAGYLVASGDGDVVVRYQPDGTVAAFAPAMASRGFDLLPDGDVVVADPDLGRLVTLDAATGAASDLGAVFVGVSGIAADRDGQVYGSYLSPGRVTQTDALTGTTTTLGEPTTQTYGVALSPDEQRLYVAGYSPDDPTIYTLDRTAAGWTAPVPWVSIGNGGGGLGGMATDTCGNVYVVQPLTCAVWRVFVDGTLEPLARVAGYSFCASVGFGSGLGGWPATTLYVATYGDVAALDVGVPGRDR